jgi:glycine dehydrogenase
MVMENPAGIRHTPLSAEIAQGRLESLLNFQTMVSELTGMELANASLLDESTAAAEAMTLLRRVSTKKPKAGERELFLVSDRCFPQTIDVLRSRAEPLGIDLHIGPLSKFHWTAARTVRCCSIQTRAVCCRILRRSSRTRTTTASSSPWAQTFWRWHRTHRPVRWGRTSSSGPRSDSAYRSDSAGPTPGSLRRVRLSFARYRPHHRCVGDAHGKTAYRMALATREQHIRREKATSNICTAQALLANMAAMYGVYHGPDGLKAIASRVHLLAQMLDGGLRLMGLEQAQRPLLRYAARSGAGRHGGDPAPCPRVRNQLPISDEGTIDIALNETVTTDDVLDILGVFASALNQPSPHADLFECRKACWRCTG